MCNNNLFNLDNILDSSIHISARIGPRLCSFSSNSDSNSNINENEKVKKRNQK